jgi:cardiolipin synthase
MATSRRPWTGGSTHARRERDRSWRRGRADGPGDRSSIRAGRALQRTSRARLVLCALAIALATWGGCARVRPHLSLPALDLSDPSFLITVQAHVSSPVVGGNAVDILLNGEEIFPAMLETVRSARRTITYGQYFYDEGPVSAQIAEALAERCAAGVDVRVLLDAFGSLGMPATYADLMRGAGCQVKYARPLSPFSLGQLNNRNHRRVLVVDGRVGFTGGSGVSRKWMGDGRTDKHWRDTDVRIEGPAVHYLQGAFTESWLGETGELLGGPDYFPAGIAPAGDVPVLVVRSSPAAGNFAIYTQLLLALSAARRSIYITNPYFIPDRMMREQLVQAVGRGVRVVVLVPGQIDHNIVRQASRRGFGDLLKAKIEIHEYMPALLHAKTIVIDGVWATVGSTNLDNRSFALNDELDVVIFHPRVAGRLEQVFLDDLAHSRRVTYQSWRSRSLADRMFELLALPIRNLL